MSDFSQNKTLFILFAAGALICQNLWAMPASSFELNKHKLKQPLEIISKLQDRKSTVRVLVGLEISDQQSPAENWRSAKNIKKLREKIHSRQTTVLSSLTISEFKPKHRYKNFASFSGKTTSEGLNKLLKNPFVNSIELVRKQQPLLAQGISLMNADVPRTDYNGQGVSIAICDTGIDYTHPMMGNGSFPNSKVIGGYDTGGTSTSLNDPDSDPFPYGPNPNSAHGTNCAGIAAGDIGAVGDYVGGVAHNARIYALKISADNDNGAWDDDTMDAWDWCVTHKNDDPNNPILIISYSFGGGKYLSAASAEAANSIFASAANDVVAAGITIFAASGNDGYCDSLAVPAAFSSVISVGAVYDSDIGRHPFDPNYVGCISNDSCAGFSSSCPCAEKCYVDETTAPDQVTTYSNSADFLDIFAPSNNAYTTDVTGSDGYSTGDYYASFGGTSAACPYAAGAAACLQSASQIIWGRYLTPAQIKYVLVSSGDDITDGKVSITKPRVNLAAAIAILESPPEAFDVSTVTTFDTPVTVALQAMDAGLPAPPSSLDYIITSLPNHGELSEPNGTEITMAPYKLAANGNQVVYTPRLNCRLNATFDFIANDGGTPPEGGDSNQAKVTVKRVDTVYFEEINSDPGWTTNDDQWQWGVPGGGGGGYGNPDPTSGYTGSNVIGYNLSGNYKKMRSTGWATTPVIDCTAMTGVTLSFYRWLNVEASLYDHAYIEVSNNGSTWNTIWENSAEITDSSWTLQTYDISAFADDQSTVYVRWGMGPTDARWHYSGWNIDDIKLVSDSNQVPLTGDFELDCDVDLGDLILLAIAWLQDDPLLDIAPEGGDGIINLMDLQILSENWLIP